MKKEVYIIFLFLCINLVIASSFEGNSLLSVGNKEGALVMFDKDGNYLKLKETPFADWEDITVADIDGDGVDEIIGLRDLNVAISIYKFFNNTLIQKDNPEEISKFSGDLDWVGIKHFDYDNDGKDELFLLNNKYGRFFMVDYEDGEYYTTFIGESSSKDWVGFDVAEMDGEPKLFAIRPDKNPIHIFSFVNNQLSDTNSIVTGEQIGNNPLSDITIFDIDSDGEKEIIVFSSSTFYVGVMNNEFYNLKLKHQTSYNDVKKMYHGDITNDGTERLIVLRTLQFPFAYFNYISNSLVEKTINNNKNFQWVGFGIGNIGYTDVEEPVVEVKEEPEIEEPVVEEVVEEPVIETPVNKESQTKSSNVWWIVLLIILVLAGIGIGIFFFLRSKKEDGFVSDFYDKVDDYLTKKQEKEAASKKEEPKKVVVKEEKEEKTTYELWPESKKSDIGDLRDIIKKRKKNK